MIDKDRLIDVLVWAALRDQGMFSIAPVSLTCCVRKANGADGSRRCC